MARGGRRSGKPGVAYPQRTDLGVAKLPAVAAPGQTYGVGKQQVDAQQAMPAAPQPTPGAAQGEGAAPGVTPGQFGPLDRPTDRPNEPLTQGAPFGPGASGVSLPMPPPDPMTATIAALNSLGDSLPPELRHAVTSLQVAQGNGAGA